MPSPVSVARSPLIDELKGLAILLVAVYHGTGLLGLWNGSQGQAGVDIFLFLSGCGLALGLRDESPRTFLVRRFGAVMPRTWAALGLTVALNGLVMGHRENARDLIAHALGLHVLFPAGFYAINGSLWFMGVVVPLYLAAAAVRPWLQAGRADRVIAAGLAVTVACHLLTGLLYPDDDGVMVPTVIVRLPEFFLGLAAGCVLRLGPQAPRVATPLLGWAVLGYGAYSALSDPRLLTSPNPVFGAVWAGWYALAVAQAGAWAMPVRRAARWFGGLSFEFYLYHQPFLIEYNRHLWYAAHGGHPPTTAELGARIVLGVALTLGLCVCARRLGPSVLPPAWSPERRLMVAGGTLAAFSLIFAFVPA